MEGIHSLGAKAVTTDTPRPLQRTQGTGHPHGWKKGGPPATMGMAPDLDCTAIPCFTRPSAPQEGFTIAVYHGDDGKKALECLASAVWDGVKSAVPLPEAIAAKDPAGALSDMAKRTGEFVEKNAPAFAAAATASLPLSSVSFANLVSGVARAGKLVGKTPELISVGLAVYEAGKSYKEQAYNRDCVGAP